MQKFVELLLEYERTLQKIQEDLAYKHINISHVKRVKALAKPFFEESSHLSISNFFTVDD
jgi:hypothetical protein